jgi:hypothetical protein
LEFIYKPKRLSNFFSLQKEMDVALYLHTNLDGSDHLKAYVSDLENVKSKVYLKDKSSNHPIPLMKLDLNVQVVDSLASFEMT